MSEHVWVVQTSTGEGNGTSIREVRRTKPTREELVEWVDCVERDESTDYYEEEDRWMRVIVGEFGEHEATATRFVLDADDYVNECGNTIDLDAGRGT